MVGVGDSGSPFGDGDTWNFASFQKEVQQRGLKQGTRISDLENNPLDVALKTSGELAEIMADEKQRQEAQRAASTVMGYKPITLTESSVSSDNVKMVKVSDIKTAHNLDIQAAPTESTLELKANSSDLDGAAKLLKINNRIFDREIIRNEAGWVTAMQDEIKLPESNIKLQVSISNEGKAIKISENGEEKKELKFSVKGEDDNQRIERPSFSEPSLSGDSPAKVFFHKKSLSPYEQPLTDQGEQVKPYENIANKYKLSVDKGIITIRDKKDSLVFLQDGEGRNYIFHPENVSDTGLVKSKQKLESSISPAAYRKALEERETQILDMLALFEKNNNPSEMRVRLPEPNSEGKTEIIVSKREIDAEYADIQKKISEASQDATKFLNEQKGALKDNLDELKMLQELLGFGGANAEASPVNEPKTNNTNILNSKQTVAMFAGTLGEVQYFNGQGKSLYGVNP